MRSVAQPTLALILGVHRSGTSLLTQGLVAAGAQMGAFQDAYDPDNPDGYAEHPKVQTFNDRLLAYLGASWDNWGFRAGLVDWDAPVLAPWQDEASALLRNIFAGDGPFVLKDPRCATLAPFWERVVPQAGFALRRIVILRDPAEVAESQHQRVARRPHEFPVIAGAEPMAALWAVAMTEVLSAFADDATLIVSHAALLANPVPTMAAAARFAGLPEASESIADFAANRVKPEYYRARVSPDAGLDGPWMAAARALFADLMRSAPPRLLPRAEAAAIVAAQSALVALLPGLPAVQDSIRRMQMLLSDRQDRIAALSKFLWIVVPLARSAPLGALVPALDSSSALAEDSDLSNSNFAFAHSVARLYLFAGRKAEGLAWIDRIRPHFGHLKAFDQIAQRLSELL